MMKYLTTMAVLATLLLSGAAACGDLVVPNLRDPDADQALANPGDVESLISGAWVNWNYNNTNYNFVGPMLSVASFQHTTRVANFGQLVYPTIPRPALNNSSTDGDYGQWANHYTYNYRAISAANDGLAAFDAGLVIEDEPGTTASSPNRNRQARAEAFARYIQGVSYGYLGIMYDRGPLIDETTDLEGGVEFVGYNELVQAGLGYLDQAIAIAEANDFEIPYEWMSVADETFTSDRFAQMMYSYKARIRAAAARTPEERQNVDWNAVLADIANGVDRDLNHLMNDVDYWASSQYYTLLQANGAWSSMPYFIHGMADQSGQYQKYMALPHGEKHPDHPSVGPMILQTPDLRFPQGATHADQMANPGTRFWAPSNYQQGWASESRGTWRWSYYRDRRDPWTTAVEGLLPDVTMVEMDMLRAEAYLRGFGGSAADAAELINQTRVPAGLNPTDANGTNTSCVPKLPDGTCGDLFEMMKWEKRMLAGHNYSLMMASWYYDSRGWGDHMEGTILNFPVPSLVAELEDQPVVNYGGNLEWGAPVGTYGF